jgi:hypothetical protein
LTAGPSTPRLLDGDAVRLINQCNYLVDRRWSQIGARMSLVSTLTAFLGLTMGEICALPFIDPHRIRPTSVLKVGGFRPRDLPFVPPIEIALRLWFEERPVDAEPFLLVSRSGRQLTPSSIQQAYVEVGAKSAFHGGLLHARLRRYAVAALERDPDVDFAALLRMRGFHKDGASENQLEEVDATRIRRMLMNGHPLRDLGETLFDERLSLAYLETADQNLPPIPQGLRGIVRRPPPKPEIRVTFTSAQWRDPTVALLLGSLWPIDVYERAKNRQILYYHHWPRIREMVLAGDLTVHHAAVLFSTRAEYLERRIEREPVVRTPLAPTQLPEAWSREIDALLSAEPRIKVGRAADHLAGRGVTASLYLLHEHLKRSGLGPYAPAAEFDGPEAANGAGESISAQVWPDSECGPLVLENPTVRLLNDMIWPVKRRAQLSQRARTRKRHYPSVHPLLVEDVLSIPAGARLFRVATYTIEAWMEKRSAFLVAGGIDPPPYVPEKSSLTPEWREAIAKVFSENPGISDREAHRRLGEDFAQSYFVLRRYVREKGLGRDEAPTPEWQIALTRMLAKEEIDLRRAHDRLVEEGTDPPSYYTVRRYAKAQGLVRGRFER